jgi:long-chain acyl-CoA synthetase
VQSFHRTFGLKIHSFYGASETGGIAYDDEDDVGERVTVGRPMPAVTIALGDVDGLDESEGRRVHVAGPAVSRAYAGAPEGEDIGFDADGFLTGDLARLDDRGRLVLCGRISSFVNVAGRKVQPEQVAVRLREMPGIADACVLGVPCPSRGERLVALVVRRSEAISPADMIRFCAQALPAYKVPRDYVVVAALPRDARGKLDRRAAAALAATATSEDR